MDYDGYDALLHYIFKQTSSDAWFKPTEENIHSGVCLRVDQGRFRVFPYENPYLQPFERAIRILNPVAAVKVRSAAIHAALAHAPEDAQSIAVDQNTKIQIVDSMSMLPSADKEQCGAFIRDERVMVVWTDDFDTIIPLAREFEEKLIKLVWQNRVAFSASNSTAQTPVDTSSDVRLNEKAESSPPESTVRDKVPKKSKWSFGWKLSSEGPVSPKDQDTEKGVPEYAPRRMRMFAPFYNGLGCALSIFFIGSGVNIMLQEFVLDPTYNRFGLLITAPFLMCVSIFFCLQVVANLSYFIGPVAQFHQNSTYYSAVKPQLNKDVDSNLPHVTIEMPVYKESLKETIALSVYSIKKAMQTYARQGGTSTIFVHDDGLQLISPEDREERIAFYADHNIGWVARPRHDNAPDGFKRAGRFKKASNMNYGLRLSLMLEKHLAELQANGASDEFECLEDQAMKLAVEEMYEESGSRFKPWAANGRSLRIGEVILIVDSDTIVPEDCFRDAARELAESPEVAIIQHESDVMQVAHHYFENGIAHFTRRINKAISMGTANGEVAPFVGHNAFLRWSALQDASFIDEADGIRKIWSESHVSEDFDMALRLQLKSYIIRWATYSQGGFKEGVSLTCDDELNRWQKYAYGCNELIFNPLRKWWRLGPISKQLRVFLWSEAPVHYKVSMMSYMFSYYGIAVGATLSLLNYFLLGFAVDVDGWYFHSFEIWLACMVVFPASGNVSFSLLEYRLGHRSLLGAFLENFTWVPFFFIFFGGLSIHISQAILAHLFSYNITWGATKKEVERSNFWMEVPKILKRFWLSLVVSTLCVMTVIGFATKYVPSEWRIEKSSWSLILPLMISAGSHILYPIVLNPWLMIFSY
ncbi:glycosyl transferase family group 2-domain-containing protein [Thelephora terrestris]|uniref:Glycosyl transferase family group 2-domain-containing protein n=1 Tax=Thelephora terrestris TaxID=56493 RepID=A0A9P6L4X0_9AGAM|nr:glycosyl transferase family group 2-domain-containing protein [Thelephora terrestris]